jgi:hypothetical protein
MIQNGNAVPDGIGVAVEDRGEPAVAVGVDEPVVEVAVSILQLIRHFVELY